MTFRHLTAAIRKREPVSAGSHDQKEGSAMRIQRLRSWFLGICVASYVSMIAAPADASVGTITKVCPDPAVKSGPDAILGTFWGYAEMFGIFMLVGSGLALMCVAFIPKLRAKVTSAFILTLIVVLFIGTFITIVTHLPGTTC